MFAVEICKANFGLIRFAMRKLHLSAYPHTPSGSLRFSLCVLTNFSYPLRDVKIARIVPQNISHSK